ncbi:MAG: tetratricopeptide repeat protein [Burkholderiales bacterium]
MIDQAQTWFNLAEAYRSIGRYEQAIESYDEAIRCAPQYYDAWLKLGETYAHAGQSNKAVEALQTAVGLRPEDTLGWTVLGSIYHVIGGRAGVLEVYNRLLKLDLEYAKKFYERFVFGR